MMNIADARRFQELLEWQDHGLPYHFDKIFPTEGWGAKSLCKRKLKLLQKTDSVIRAMLEEGEEVLYITSGVQTSFAESYFLGWLMYLINRRAFVFTSRRILLIQIKTSDKPSVLRAEIAYAALSEMKGTGLGSFQVKFNNRRKLIFTSIPRKDRKLLAEMVAFIREGVVTEPDTTHDVQNLCPSCFAKVYGFPPACSECSVPFKSPGKAGWLSFIFPGLGDFYLGQHRFFACIELCFTLFIWAAIVLPLLFGVGGDEAGGSRGEGLIAALVIVIFVHGVDALGVRHVARKGIYPGKRIPTTRRSASDA